MKLDGLTALVTGGASGIGAAVVNRLTEAGCRTAVADVKLADVKLADVKLADVKLADVKPADVKLGIECDVAVEADVVGAFEHVRETWGRLDVAVLAAGVGGMAPITEMTSAEWDRVVGVNLRGTFLCLREAATLIADGERGGAIVAVSSVSGFLADRLTGHYNASKAAVDMLVRVAARELGPKVIRVNAVAPGTTDTPLFARTARLPGYQQKVAARTALGRIGTADDVAAAVIALIELDWVTGHVLVADGGLSLWSPIDVLESMDIS